MYDYGARWYDPHIGRFTSADSLVPDTKNPQAFNHYAYVFNSPLRYVDPSGNIPCEYCLPMADDGLGGGYYPPTNSRSGSSRSNGSPSDQDEFIGDTRSANQINSIGRPDFWINGGGVNATVWEAGVETIYDFTTNQIAMFWKTGFGAGTDALGASIGAYSGRGWKGAYRDRSIDEAYTGPSMSTTYSFVLPWQPIVSVGVSYGVTAQPVRNNTIWLFRPDLVTTITFPVVAGADFLSLRHNGRQSFVNYTPIWRPLSFPNDWSFASAVWTSSNLSFSDKVQMSYYIFTTRHTRPQERRR